MSEDRPGATVGPVTTNIVRPTEPAQLRAREAAERCGVEVRALTGIDEMAAADGLLRQIWGGGDSVPANLMKALAHSEHYLVGAWSKDELVGVCIGFAYGPGRPNSLHSHISGVDPQHQGRGIGFALKMHQAAWALERRLESVTWTFDPLIRRNAWFNLVKLGARAEAYYPDFYGEMSDGINSGEVTDRLFAVWDLQGPAAAPQASGEATVILRVGGGDQPEAEPAPPDGRLLCQVPADHLELRRRDPGLGRRWRESVRATMGRAMAAGYDAVSITPDGYYVLDRRSK